MPSVVHSARNARRPNGSRPGVRRHRRVERRVEHGHLRGVRVPAVGHLDALDVRRVVQRGERHQLADLREHLVVDEDLGPDGLDVTSTATIPGDQAYLAADKSGCPLVK